jgi:hypothetical protein
MANEAECTKIDRQLSHLVKRKKGLAVACHRDQKSTPAALIKPTDESTS